LTQKTFFSSPIPTNRDLLVFQLSTGELMVVGCDSAGGIGPKPLDKLKVNGYTLGKFTARVPLMEIMSVGATPVCVVDNLCMELNPTGDEVLEGIRDEAKKAGLDPKLAVTGSSEKNFSVEQSGIGITVIGLASKKSLRIGTSQPEDLVVSVGNPCVGAEVVSAENNGLICDVVDVLRLLSLDFVHEIIPVGSEGIKHEVDVLAEGSKLKFKRNLSVNSLFF
jgi:selenophosphate synthetase-related protein